jgi:hypothetical protein
LLSKVCEWEEGMSAARGGSRGCCCGKLDSPEQRRAAKPSHERSQSGAWVAWLPTA